MMLRSCCLRCFGRRNGDALLWHTNLKPHASGEFSIAVVQANSNLEDQSQVYTSPSATYVGVYDGHGGPEASRFVNRHLFLYLHNDGGSFHFLSWRCLGWILIHLSSLKDEEKLLSCCCTARHMEFSSWLRCCDAHTRCWPTSEMVNSLEITWSAEKDAPICVEKEDPYT